MNFVTQWLDSQLKDFSKRINAVFVKKNDLKKYTTHESGLYKITVDADGNISSAVPVTKEDIVKLGVAYGFDFSIGDDGNLYVTEKSGS